MYECAALSILSCMPWLGLGLDLDNSLDQREESARALIHEWQSFQKKATAHA